MRQSTKPLPSILLPLLALLCALAGCGDDDDTPGDGGSTADAGGDPLAFTDDLTAGSTIPPRHKCPMSVVGGGTGDNLSPPLSWSGAPAGTASFAVVLSDTRYGFFHWALWDIPPDLRALPEGIPAGFEVQDPAGARQLGNAGSEGHGYFGPCSDAGPLAGVYEFRLHALDVASLGLSADASSDAVVEAIEAASLESVAWEGTPE